VGKPILAIAAGDHHTCAVIGNGEVVCWGAQSTGELGNGMGTGQTATPQPTGLMGIVGVATGSTHSCAWNATAVWCWGSNAKNELGTGLKVLSSSVPVQVAGIP
jgi:alpha-tubulin suppressor-like RCC1 family protein